MLSVGLFLVGCVVLAQAFFFFGDEEPLLFCLKVCPLYCSPRRHDDDASSLIYIDDSPYIPYKQDHEDHEYHADHEYLADHEYHADHKYHADHEVVPYDFDPYYFCKPHKSTTTTPAPTTTMKTSTAEPSGICKICMRKCTKYPIAKKS